MAVSLIKKGKNHENTGELEMFCLRHNPDAFDCKVVVFAAGRVQQSSGDPG